MFVALWFLFSYGKTLWFWCFCIFIFPPSWQRKWTTWSRAGLWAPRWTFSTTWGYTEEQSIMVLSHYGQLTWKSDTPAPPTTKVFTFLKWWEANLGSLPQDEAMKWWSAAVACGCIISLIRSVSVQKWRHKNSTEYISIAQCGTCNCW